MLPKSGNRKKQRGEGIVRAGALFEKYKKILRAPERSVVDAFITAVAGGVPNIHITQNQCVYNPRTRTLTLKMSGPLRTEILINKREILSKMQDVLGPQNTPREIV